MNLKKFLLPIVALLVLIVGLVIGFSLVKRPIRPSTSASASLVDLSLSPSATTISPDQTVTINILVNSHTYKVVAAEIVLEYPADKLKGVSLVPGDFLPLIFVPSSISPGSASITLGSGTSGHQGSGVLAILTLKATSSGPALISFAPNTQISGLDANGNAVPTNILGDSNATTLTIASAPTPTPTPTPTLIPLPTDEPSSPQFPWIPVVGISAAVLGLIVFLILKFRRPPLDIPPVSPPQST